METPVVISAKNLTKRYRDMVAVDGVSFAIRRGECFGFLGPNGAGKTTTMRMITCLSPVTGGEQSVDGKDVATTIGVMNNFFALFLIPMFYVSGVFFPLDRLPQAVQTASWALPLTSVAALMRGLLTGDPSWWMLLWTLELVVISLVAMRLASILMRRRLVR